MEFKDVKHVNNIAALIKNIVNIYDIKQSDIKHIIISVFELSTYYRLFPFFNNNNELVFADKKTGNIYNASDARRYINMSVAKELFTDAVSDSSAMAMLVKYGQYKRKNVFGVVLNLDKNNYVVDINVGEDNIIGILPIGYADRRFEFDYGVKYEFYIYNMVHNFENHTFKIILSRIARGFAANVISRVLKKNNVRVYKRIAGRVSYVDLPKPDKGDMDMVKLVLQETIMFKPKS